MQISYVIERRKSKITREGKIYEAARRNITFQRKLTKYIQWTPDLVDFKGPCIFVRYIESPLLPAYK